MQCHTAKEKDYTWWNELKPVVIKLVLMFFLNQLCRYVPPCCFSCYCFILWTASELSHLANSYQTEDREQGGGVVVALLCERRANCRTWQSQNPIHQTEDREQGVVVVASSDEWKFFNMARSRKKYAEYTPKNWLENTTLFCQRIFFQVSVFFFRQRIFLKKYADQIHWLYADFWKEEWVLFVKFQFWEVHTSSTLYYRNTNRSNVYQVV